MKSGMFDPNARSNPPFQHSSSGNASGNTTGMKMKEQLNIDGNAGTRLRWDILPQDIKRKKAIIVSRGCTKGDKIAEPSDGLIAKNEQPALLKEVINLWLSVEVYRVKLWKDIKNAPEHYMEKLNQVLNPVLTSKDVPDKVKVPVQLILIFVKLFSSSKKTEPENVSLNRLYGMDSAISQMRKILKRLQGSAEYDRMNVKLPSGILIRGPTRTGKSSLVHAFAREAKLPFFVVHGKDIEKNPPIITSLFSEARVSSPSIIYIEGIEVISSAGISQILDQMESCERDGAVIVVIATADNVKTLVEDIQIGFDMSVHLGKPDTVSRTKMVDGLMKDYVLLEDRDKICKYIASETSGMVWKSIKAICNECCARAVEERETAIDVCSWVTLEDVTKTLKDSMYEKSMLQEKDATGKEDGTTIG